MPSNINKLPEFSNWMHMKQRCYNKNNKNYALYGGRGITVCERWLTSFANFMADMGPRGSNNSVERIDNSKGYSPSNCVWANQAQQNRNRRGNVVVEAFGEKKLLVEWAEETGIRYQTLKARIRIYGWPPEKAISTPIQNWGR